MNDNQNNNSNQDNSSDANKRLGTDSYWDKYDERSKASELQNNDFEEHKQNVAASEDVDEFVVPDEHALNAVPSENTGSAPSSSDSSDNFMSAVPPQDSSSHNMVPPAQNDFTVPQNPNNMNNIVSEAVADNSRSDVMDQNIGGGMVPGNMNPEPSVVNPPSDMNSDPSEIPQVMVLEPQVPDTTPATQAPDSQMPENTDNSNLNSQEPAQAPEENKIPGPEDLPKTPPIASTFDSNPAAGDTSAVEEIKTDKVINRNRKKPIIAAISAIAILILGASAFLFVSRAGNLKAPGLASAGDIKKIVSNVAELVNLPIKEQPSQIANITDTSKLTGNPFFANAAVGDVVLIYPKNQQAILYRPSTNRVVAIGPLDNRPTQSVAGVSTEATPTVTPASPSATPIPTSAPTVAPRVTPRTDVSPSSTPAQ